MTYPHDVPRSADRDDHGPAAGQTGPGVPLTVWPGLPAPAAGCGPGHCEGLVTPAAAGKIITAFSHPGDLIAALDGCPAVIQAAAGRRVLAVTAGGPGDTHAPAGLPARPSLAAGLRTSRLGQVLAPGDPDAGQAALAITSCHDPGCDVAPGADTGGAGLVYAAAQRLLAAGGILAVITATHAPGDDRLAGQAGHTVAAARAAGLLYTQHVVLVHAVIRDGHLDPGAAAPPAQPGGRRIHSDLLIFIKPGRPA